MRAIIIDDAGKILRTVTCDPLLMVLQANPGESVFALTEGDDGALINDASIRVSEHGEFISSSGEAPDIELQFVTRRS